jgi:hypothetical protein
MRKALIAIIAVCLAITVVLAVLLVQQGVLPGIGGSSGSATPTAVTTLPTAAPITGLLHVEGTQIIDASGHPVLLHGAQIESPFNYIKNWGNNKKINTVLNQSVFDAMVKEWKMNVLRLPISNWIYAKYPTDYLAKLDQVVQEANTAGLYIVLDLHDNGKAGSPYPKEGTLPKVENVGFWKIIAAHYKENPKILYDLYNEPQEPDWQTWLHGGGQIGGATSVGFQDLVDAVRSTGARQIIVLEPGSAGKGKNNGIGNSALVAEEGGWSTLGAIRINDNNVIYSLHEYQGIAATPEQQDAKWGPILNHYPLYYGEWAFLPNSYTPAQCKGVSHDAAPQDVSTFLNYAQSRNASWSAWAFVPPYLIQNDTSFAPTSLDVPWTCGDTKTVAGMGSIIKDYLATH